jgi:ornithine cyclodeaminase/alanine dehydrogenase-like protein (mu-crystallin family)
LRGHTYSNVTVKLIPYGLGWYAKDGSEGRLAITNLDEVTLADITGLSTNQVAYLIYKKAMEDGAYIPQEAAYSTTWWLAPYSQGLYEV